MAFANRDLTGIQDFTRDELMYVLDKAALMKQALHARKVDRYRLAAGKDLLAALLFYENSTRTRTSFEVAAQRLGMNVTGFAGVDGTSVKKGESLRHTLDMYEAYQCDCIIMRHPLDGSARFAAEHLGIPIFNAGDGKHEHPTQTLLDLFTIREHLGRLDDFDMGISGDLKFGRTAHSLAIALTKFTGVRLHLFSHPSLAMPQELLELMQEAGVEVTVYPTLTEAAQKTDVLYQTRIQKERMPDLTEYDKAKSISEFTSKIMEKTRDGFGLMHPLPVDKAAPSIAAELDKHPKALYKIQAGNGVPTRLTELALALGLMGNDFNGEVFRESVCSDDFVELLPIKDKPPRKDVSIRPIRNNGVVIDHMAPYMEEILTQVLKVRERRDIYRAATVKAASRPDSKESIKGMLMIEDRTLTENELKIVASVSPGCTVNIIENGTVTFKYQLRLPDRVCDVPGMMCTNKGCISRPEHQESVSPRMVKVGDSRVKCYYCEQVMNTSQIV
ncbi:MAG: aspartate carbamoyltransferase [Deltaproteobacteria bacterium]|nr:aspartate carbamoyltransferase [Deltaproteobacteria bacterium]MBN2673770.1 aspartate carbamoyltransferase [Deltaproteobacteria bacterium]